MKHTCPLTPHAPRDANTQHQLTPQPSILTGPTRLCCCLLWSLRTVPTGGGITVQPGIHRITDCLVRVTPYVHNTRDAVVVFFGTLSNLPDLVARRREFRPPRGSGGSPPVGASGTWLSSSPPGHVSGGAAHGSEATGTGAQTTSCLLDMYKHFADGRELLLLSELQVGAGWVMGCAAAERAAGGGLVGCGRCCC